MRVSMAESEAGWFAFPEGYQFLLLVPSKRSHRYGVLLDYTAGEV